MEDTTTFAIYVASLSDYNAGILHGLWINLDHCEDLEDLKARVDHMLFLSPTAEKENRPAEEYAIHGYEGFGENDISECTSLSEVWELYEDYSQADSDDNLEPYIAYKSYYSGDYSDFLDSYKGRFASKEAFARQFVEEMEMLSNVNEFIQMYIDYEALSNDIFGNDFSYIDGYVFSEY